jgi:1-aminocyclopropane-1-carboxylate deaminase/D-cysteine desulfhydrase-like pyridoxal-dependent ACC family enzyme
MRDLEISSFEFLRDCPEMEKIVIDEVYDIQSLRGLERMGKLKEVLIGRLLKADDLRLGHLEQ